MDIKSTYELNVDDLEKGCNKGVAKLSEVEAQSKKTADAAEAALNKLGKAQEELANRRLKIEQKSAEERTYAERTELTEIMQAEEEATAEKVRLERVKTAAVQLGTAARTAAVRAAGAAELEVLAETSHKVGEVGGELMKMAGLTIGVELVAKVFESLGEAAAKARDHLKENVAEALRLQGVMTSLASMQGKKPTLEFTKEQLEFAAKTGLKVEDVAAGREEYAGLVNQEHLPDKQRDQAELGAAQLARTKGIEFPAMAEAAGALTRNTDYSKFGAQASGQLVADLAQLSSLVRGSGVAGAPFLRGVNQIAGNVAGVGPMEAAQMIRTVGKGGAGRGAVSQTLAALQAIGPAGFGNDKTRDLLERAGITEENVEKLSPEQKFRMIGKAMHAEGHASGKSDEAVLASHTDPAVARALNQLIKATEGGGFDKLRAAGAELTPERVAKEIAGDLSDPSQGGALARAQNQFKVTEFEEGEARAKLAPLYEQAKDVLTKKGEIGPGNFGANLKEHLMDTFSPGGPTFGGASFREDTIAQQVAVEQHQRGAKVGLDLPYSTGVTPAQQTKLFTEREAAIAEATLAENKKQTAALEKLAAGARGGPAPLPLSPGGGRAAQIR